MPGPAPDLDDLNKRLLRFVRTNNNITRADVFIKEYLAGETGFYSSQLDIVACDYEVPTPTNRSPLYSEYLARAVFGIVLAIVTDNPTRSHTEPIEFAEVGGGSGKFKQAFIAWYNQHREECKLPELKYTSIDINPRHLSHQQKFGGVGLKGSITNTGLADTSVDFLFDEEVLDCLPFRVFKFDPASGKIISEAFISLKDDKLELHFEAAEKDERMEHAQAYLRSRNYRRDYYCYCEDYFNYLTESSRVLKNGGLRISTDYNESVNFLNAPEDEPIAVEQLRKAIELPYMRDITHGVDFRDLYRLASLPHFMLRPGVKPMENFMRLTTPPEEVFLDCFSRAFFIAKKLS